MFNFVSLIGANKNDFDNDDEEDDDDDTVKTVVMSINALTTKKKKKIICWIKIPNWFLFCRYFMIAGLGTKSVT